MSWRHLTIDGLPDLRRDAVDAATLEGARAIVEAVRDGGEAALRAHAERFGDIAEGAPLVIGREALEAALAGLPEADRS
ncbi:MAG: hypothetical protein EP329_01995, partial [Deltaproteobacteria bacterium]